MIKHSFQNLELSALGFGTMRFPKVDGVIDEQQVQEMVDYAIENGVNYFDTAYPYHEGKSEIIIGNCLKKHPRSSFYLADKLPAFTEEKLDVEKIFHEQLAKCQVDYFDFYLLHNVSDKSIHWYKDDENYGYVNQVLKLKEQGLIKHLGFSCHASPENLEMFLDKYPNVFEFVQIQLNYLDYSLQDAKRKVEIIHSHSLPVWVMEPVRGGKLVNLFDKHIEKLKTIRENETPASWAFRFIQSIPEVTMTLSGMSNMEQMQSNIETFSQYLPTNEEERKVLFEIADELQHFVPCTKCRYCTEGCPIGLEIPDLIELFNQSKYSSLNQVKNAVNSLEEDKKPSNCIGCGQCASICPQQIQIPDILSDLNELVNG